VKNLSTIKNIPFLHRTLYVILRPFLILCASHFLLSTSLHAQQKNIPLNREWGLNTDNYILGDTANIHTQFRPLIESRAVSQSLDSLLASPRPHRTLIGRKLFQQSFLIVNDTADKFHLTIDPLFNFEFGSDLEDSLHEKLYKNTRGVRARGDIGDKFSFETSFYENQATFAQYIDNFNNTYIVVPGQGRWKKFKTNGYDFAMASGYFSYAPSKHFNIQAGHGKHFVGDGYRSLLLSDNSFNYPYARITTSFGKLQYTNLYTMFMNLTAGGVTTPIYTERLFQKKAGSFQVLSLNVGKILQLGLFQGIIWEATDTKNKQHLNVHYFDPVIFANTVVYSLDATQNVLLGSTVKLKLSNSMALYGQFMLDDFSKDGGGALRNKQGFQAGFKYFDVLKIKNLHLQMEYNQVRPYVYAHTDQEQSYTHYNQALAHPLGANFKETIAILNYRAGNFFTEIKINHSLIGKDSLGRSYGNNIFADDDFAYYGNGSTVNLQNQGVKTTLDYIDIKIGYLVNPSTNFNILMGASLRKENNPAISSKTSFIYLGIRTSLGNNYYDF